MYDVIFFTLLFTIGVWCHLLTVLHVMVPLVVTSLFCYRNISMRQHIWVIASAGLVFLLNSVWFFPYLTFLPDFIGSGSRPPFFLAASLREPINTYFFFDSFLYGILNSHIHDLSRRRRKNMGKRRGRMRRHLFVLLFISGIFCLSCAHYQKMYNNCLQSCLETGYKRFDCELRCQEHIAKLKYSEAQRRRWLNQDLNERLFLHYYFHDYPGRPYLPYHYFYGYR